jgi:hypothetical protein
VVEASTIIAPPPSRVIAALAHRRAIKAVKHQIKAKGLRLADFAYRAIVAQAEEYLIEHRTQLIEEAAEMVRGCAELRKMYKREQRERQRWLARNSKHTHKT